MGGGYVYRNLPSFSIAICRRSLSQSTAVERGKERDQDGAGERVGRLERVCQHLTYLRSGALKFQKIPLLSWGVCFTVYLAVFMTSIAVGWRVLVFGL